MTKIIQRHDTAANWTSVNPILAQGEMGIETDTRKFKFGDGTTAWTDLVYASSEGGGGEGASDYNKLINKPVIESTELKGTIALAAPLKIEKSVTDSLYNATINESNQITLSTACGLFVDGKTGSAKYWFKYGNISINSDSTITCGSYIDIPYSIGDILLAGRGASDYNYIQILFGCKDSNGFIPVFASGGNVPSGYNTAYTPTSSVGDIITRYSTNYFKYTTTTSTTATVNTTYTTTVNSAYRKLQLIYDESSGLYNIRGHYGTNSSYNNYSINANMNGMMAKVNTVRIISTSALTTASEYTGVVVKQFDGSVNPFVDMTLNDVLALPNVNIPEVAEHNVLSVGAIPNSYDGLDDKPKLNGNVLSGNINSTDLNIQRVLTPNGGINIVQNGDWHFFDASYDDITKKITFDRYNLYDSNNNYADTFTYQLNSTNSSASKIGTYVDSTKIIPTCGIIMPFYKNVTWKFGYATFAPCNRLVFGNYIDGYFYPKYVTCPCYKDTGTDANTNLKKITSISQTSTTVFTSTNVPISSTTSYNTSYNPTPVSAIGIFYDNNTYIFDFNMTNRSSVSNTIYRRRKVVDSSETAGLDSCTHCWYIPNNSDFGYSVHTQLATGNFCAKALVGDLSNTDMNDALILPDSGSNVFTTSISVKTDGVTTKINNAGELEAIPQKVNVATIGTVGVVKPDGSTITIAEDGTISSTGGGGSSSIATTETAGIVKPDGSTITVTNDGTISSVAPANMITTDNIASDATIVGMNNAINMAQGDITTLNETVATKTDKVQAARVSMPSDRFTDLTAGASGTTYTAPANGWFAICAWNNVAHGVVVFSNESKFTSPSVRNAWAGGNIQNNIPCKKGDIITLVYDDISLTNADNYFRFYYAEGEK